MGYLANAMKRLLFTLITLILLGCSSNNIYKNVYDALLQRECIQKTGEPNCESGQPSYENYSREREDIKKQE